MVRHIKATLTLLYGESIAGYSANHTRLVKGEIEGLLLFFFSFYFARNTPSNRFAPNTPITPEIIYIRGIIAGSEAFREI